MVGRRRVLEQYPISFDYVATRTCHRATFCSIDQRNYNSSLSRYRASLPSPYANEKLYLVFRVSINYISYNVIRMVKIVMRSTKIENDEFLCNTSTYRKITYLTFDVHGVALRYKENNVLSFAPFEKRVPNLLDGIWQRIDSKYAS